MSKFSKDKLFKMVTAAKRHWWLFFPILLFILIGYFISSCADSVLIFLLHIRNFFLKIYCAIKRGIKKIFIFIGHGLRFAGSKTSFAYRKAGEKLHQMNANARTARDQLLNDAVTYCASRHQKRADKKDFLRAEAQKLLSKKEDAPGTIISSNSEITIPTAINKAAG